MKDYFDILGLARTASEDDIKKAYKKIMLKYHPDRMGNKSDKEKKEAEEIVKSANEAYETLSDPQKKQEYDNPGFGDGFNPFANFFGHDRSNGPSWNTEDYRDLRGTNCEGKLNVDISDFYFRGIKSVAYLKDFRCNVCDGEGGTGVKVCSHCNGTGMVTESKWQGNMFFQSSHPCPYCNGKGKTVEHKCAACSGTGFIGKLVSEEIDLSRIPLQYLLKDGIKINVGPLGSESKSPNGKNGELYITVQHTYDHNKYHIDNYGNVEGKEDIDWKDVMLGGKIEINLPGNQKMRINLPECSEVGKKLRIKGKGINGHDYTMVVNPIFPKTLDKETKKAIERLKEKG